MTADPLVALEVALHQAQAEEERHYDAWQMAETAAIAEYREINPRGNWYTDGDRDSHNAAELERAYIEADHRAQAIEGQIADMSASTPEGVAIRMRLLAKCGWRACSGRRRHGGKLGERPGGGGRAAGRRRRTIVATRVYS